MFDPLGRPKARSLPLLFATLASLVGGAALPAYAQTAQGDGAALQEIVVTVQRREQNLVDVPEAVSAVSGSDLPSR